MKKILVILLCLVTSVQAQTRATNVNRVSVSFTPDTAIYASGDVIGATGAGAGTLVFPAILGSSMKGFVTEVNIADTQGLDVSYDLKCKPKAFTATITDQSAFDPDDAELPLLTGFGVLSTDNYDYSDNGEESLSNIRHYVYSETPNSTATSRGNLYCVLISRGTPDWDAAQTVTVTLTVETLQ